MRDGVSVPGGVASGRNSSHRIQGEPVAVIGIGCRIPGSADNAERFWRLMIDGVDAITEVPADRWSSCEYDDPIPTRSG